MVVPEHRRFVVVRTVRAALIVTLALAMAAALLTGCAKKGPSYLDGSTAYTKATALVVLEKADTKALSGRPTADGVKLRHEALAALRREGQSASAVADLLTRTFPSDTTGVPVYIERATFDGKPAVLVVEATGPESGSLSTKSLWVVADDGNILFAGGR
jgi:predicted small lipoprotein YifL